MNKDYVSLEVAKLLKEKGFDWFCNNKQYLVIERVLDSLNPLNSLELKIYSRPRLFIAQEWLRKEKGIYVWVEPVVGGKWTVSFCDLNVSAEESDWVERELHKDGYPIYNTFEEALQTGILEALKLI